MWRAGFGRGFGPVVRPYIYIYIYVNLGQNKMNIHEE